MATQRGGQRAPDRREIDDAQMAAARPGVTEALAELRRLAENPSIQAVERVLAGLANAPSGAGAGIEAVRTLRRWGAEYLRVADDLEAAARCCRLAEREIGQRIDALLVHWEGQPGPAPARQRDAPAGTHRRRGLRGWFRRLSHRGRAGQRQRGDRPVPGRHARRAPPLVLSSASSRQQHAPAAPAADVAALVLGPLELSVAGRRVPRWNSLKARAVFQYLLIHQDRPVKRDVLIDLQWPDHSYNSARNNLNVALHSLRGTLQGPGQGVQPILYRDGCYLLNPDLTWWIDRNEFLSALHDAERARRGRQPEQIIGAYEKAIQLYRGPLFEDDPAGEWYLLEQGHLKDLYLQALEHVADAYRDLGELTAAVRFGQLAISTDPCCEPAHRLLMRCFASQHQQQLVCRQYRFCVTALQDELGVRPGEETVQLFRSLTTAR
jgi:DNA-binding SARP family transcriptional activator